MSKQPMMQAFRMLEWGKAPQLVEIPRPEPAAGQVLVRVAGTGVCGSDPKMHTIPAQFGEMLGWHMPFTLGHEVGGWIESLGAGVIGLREGDAVALVSSHSCGRCGYCLEGHDHSCTDGNAGRGYGRDGGLASHVLVEDPREIILLKSLDPALAPPLTCAGSTSYHGVRRVLPKLLPGATAVVIGVGGLGSFAIQQIRAMSSASVLAVDINPARVDYARELGATALHIDAAVSADTLRSALGGDAAAVLDFVGSDATIAAGLGSLRRGGSFGLVGSGGGKFNGEWYSQLPRDADIFTYEGATIADTRAVIELAESGRIEVDVERFAFDRVGEAYELLREGQLRGRAVITPH